MADSELLLTIPELVDAVDGTCLCNFSPANGFSSVATDSRKVVTFFIRAVDRRNFKTAIRILPEHWKPALRLFW